MEPPACVQNAMMTKDKKPFTYTPGGLNLSEIRSPRMARRIERNANYGGVSEAPKPSPLAQNVGPLPPQTLAAMQPQMHVQVFPAGPPQALPGHGRASAVPPPPPPPTANCKIPPPPPLHALPTQKVVTSDNQVCDRPDMTKIIPENPMTLLRKTGGPKPRNTLLDQIYNEPIQNVQQHQVSGPHQQAQWSAPNQNQIRDQPQIQQQMSPAPQYPAQAVHQIQQQNSPPMQQQSSPQWSVPVQHQSQSQKSPPVQLMTPELVQVQNAPRWQPPIIERVEQPRNGIQRQNSIQKSGDQNKNSTVQLGSLYIPPINDQVQQSQQGTAQNRNVVSPPTPPERSPNVQSPSTPTLKEAPKPWQIKSSQPQPEVPAWAKRDSPPSATSPQTVQQEEYQNSSSRQLRWPQGKPISPVMQVPHQQYEPSYQQSPQRSVPVHIEIQLNQHPQNYRNASNYQNRQQEENSSSNGHPHPNAVYVTQPAVFYNPEPNGNRPQFEQNPQHQKQYIQPKNIQQKHQQENTGTRIIPIQVEGANNNQSPRVSTPGSADRSLSRQQSWSNNPTQSNSFKVIQKFTHTDNDEFEENQPVEEHSPKFPQNFQQVPADQIRRMKMSDDDRDLMNRFRQVPQSTQNTGARSPQVRTIPVQMEPDNSGSQYVPPSEQCVQEPKKYTGSSIPGRSFKMLQAMTASDACAYAKNEANDTNETYDPSNYINWGYYPPIPPPYWHYYYPPHPSPYPLSENEASDEEVKCINNMSRTTPLPYSVCRPDVTNASPNVNDDNHRANSTTPHQFYGYYYSPSLYPPMEENQNLNQYQTYAGYSPYPPYYNPYYYPYYYGHPPPPYSMRLNGDMDGCSSTDETSFNIEKNIHDVVATPRIVITPTFSEVNETQSEYEEKSYSESDILSDSDSDTEVEEEVVYNLHTSSSGLQAIKSVKDIRIFTGDIVLDKEPIIDYVESISDESDDDSSSSSNYVIEDDIEPHQLSIIFEESERSDNYKAFRENSVLSDCTTIDGKSDEEAETFTQIEGNHFSLPPKICENTLASGPLPTEALLPCKTNITRNNSDTNEEITDFHKAATVPLTLKDLAQCLTEAITNVKISSCETNVEELKDMKCEFISIRTENQVCEDIKSKLEQQNEIFVNNTNKASSTKIEQQSVSDEPVYSSDDICRNMSDHENISYKNETGFTGNTTSKEDAKEESDGEDWWGILGNDEEKLPVKRSYSYVQESNDIIESKPSLKETDLENEILDQKQECDVFNNFIESQSSLKKTDSEEEVPDQKQECDVSNNFVETKPENLDEIDFWSVIQNEADNVKNDTKGSTNSSNSSYSKMHGVSGVNDMMADQKLILENPIADSVRSTIKTNYVYTDISEIDVDNNKNKLNVENNELILDNDNNNNNDNAENNISTSNQETCTSSECIHTKSIFRNIDNGAAMKDSIQHFDNDKTLSKVNNVENSYEIIDSSKNFVENNIQISDNKESLSSENTNAEGNFKVADDNDTFVENAIKIIDGKKNIDSGNSNSAYTTQTVDSKISVFKNSNQITDNKKIIANESMKGENTINMVTSSKSAEKNVIQSIGSKDITTSKRLNANTTNKIIYKSDTSLKDAIQILNSNKLKTDNVENTIKIVNDSNNFQEDDLTEYKSPSIKDRIKSLQGNVNSKKCSLQVTKEFKVNSIKHRLSLGDEETLNIMEETDRMNSTKTKSLSSKSSVKSFEDNSEEDVDSGVTSDMSKPNHSDNEEFPELRKMTKYQRASTHSRLFKLLQEECEDEEDEVIEQHCMIQDTCSRKNQLTLALSNINDSSSDNNVDNKLANELVHSMLKQKKGQIFRNMSMEKLHAAAKKILQDDVEILDTPSEGFSEFMSPFRNDTGNSTAAQTPQEFYGIYNDYSQYYNSWGVHQGELDILPSKAFKLIQEHAGFNKTGAITGLLAKCPKVLSAKNVHQELMKLADCTKNSSSNPTPNDRTSTEPNNELLTNTS